MGGNTHTHTHTHTHNTRQTATVEKRTFPQKVLIQQPNTQPGLLTEQRIEPITKESQLAVYQPLRTWRQRQACDSQNREAIHFCVLNHKVCEAFFRIALGN